MTQRANRQIWALVALAVIVELIAINGQYLFEDALAAAAATQSMMWRSETALLMYLPALVGAIAALGLAVVADRRGLWRFAAATLLVLGLTFFAAPWLNLIPVALGTRTIRETGSELYLALILAMIANSLSGRKQAIAVAVPMSAIWLLTFIYKVLPHLYPQAPSPVGLAVTGGLLVLSAIGLWLVARPGADKAHAGPLGSPAINAQLSAIFGEGASPVHGVDFPERALPNLLNVAGLILLAALASAFMSTSHLFADQRVMGDFGAFEPWGGDGLGAADIALAGAHLLPIPVAALLVGKLRPKLWVPALCVISAAVAGVSAALSLPRELLAVAIGVIMLLEAAAWYILLFDLLGMIPANCRGSGMCLYFVASAAFDAVINGVVTVSSFSLGRGGVLMLEMNSACGLVAALLAWLVFRRK